MCGTETGGIARTYAAAARSLRAVAKRINGQPLTLRWFDNGGTYHFGSVSMRVSGPSSFVDVGKGIGTSSAS